MTLDKEVQKRGQLIDEAIKEYLPKIEGYQKKLLEAVAYSMRAPGKRIRPMLMQETFRLFNGREEGILLPFMAAIEMIHTYSLVHDDLPAMDNDTYRRGRKTTHIVYGEAMGILAGDALLNLGFETALKSIDTITHANSQASALLWYGRIGKALQVLSQKAGVYGMIGGQAVDVENNDLPMEQEKLDFIYELKTSALIEAAMMTGAILAGAKDEEVDRIQCAAKNIGLAFQIQDDILDVTADWQELGKPTHSDERNHKTTYVNLKGLDKAKDLCASYSEEAISILKSLSNKNPFLIELVQWLVYRKK